MSGGAGPSSDRKPGRRRPSGGGSDRRVRARAAGGRPAEGPPAAPPAATWIFGPSRVAETLQAIPEQVRRVILRTGRLEARHQAVLKIARARGVRLNRAPNEELERLAAAAGGARHQGAACETSPVRWRSLSEILAADPPLDLLLVLDRIEDPRNFGALVRTADGAGVDAVLAPRRGAAPPSAAAVAASSGALAAARLVRVPGTASALLALRQAGFWTVGLSPKGSARWHEFDWTQRVALVVGAEGRGLRPGVSERCDALLSLPQHGAARSLNVSVAAGIALYEALRQRGEAKPRSGAAAAPREEPPSTPVERDRAGVGAEAARTGSGRQRGNRS